MSNCVGQLYIEAKFGIKSWKVRNLENMLFALMISLGIISTVSCLLNPGPIAYSYLFALPFGFTLISFLFWKNLKGMICNYIKGIIIGVCFIKDVVTPMLLSLNRYETNFYKVTESSINFAVALLLYEYLCITFFLFISENQKKKNKFCSNSIVFVHGGMVLISVVTAFCAIAYVVIPEMRMTFLPIFKMSDIVSLDGGVSLSIGIRRVFYTLAGMFFPIALLYVVALLIYTIRRRRGEGIGSLFIACFSTIIMLMFVSQETGYTLICVLILFFLIYQIYPSKRSFLRSMGVIVFLIAIAAIYKAKVEASSGANIGMMFQAYFPGVANTAGIYNYVGPEPKFNQWFYELYNGIPFKTTLFGVFFDRLVIDYCIYNETIYQIIPLTAQAYYFYGFLLAPIDAIILCKIALLFYEKAQKSPNVFKFCTFLLIAVFAAVTIGMYNMTTFFSRVLNAFLPMIIIIKLTDDQKCSFKRLI